MIIAGSQVSKLFTLFTYCELLKGMITASSQLKQYGHFKGRCLQFESTHLVKEEGAHPGEHARALNEQCGCQSPAPAQAGDGKGACISALWAEMSCSASGNRSKGAASLAVHCCSCV